MVIIIFYFQKLSQEEFYVQKEIVKEFFIRGFGVVCGLILFYFQESIMICCSYQQFFYQFLFGEFYIFEEFLSLKICIFLDVFFQINIVGVEMLYWIVGELIGVNFDIIFFDICCGIGVIGFFLVQYIFWVFGIELLEQVVEDVRWIVVFNGIINFEFYIG